MSKIVVTLRVLLASDCARHGKGLWEGDKGKLYYFGNKPLTRYEGKIDSYKGIGSSRGLTQYSGPPRRAKRTKGTGIPSGEGRA